MVETLYLKCARNRPDKSIFWGDLSVTWTNIKVTILEYMKVLEIWHIHSPGIAFWQILGSIHSNVQTMSDIKFTLT